MKFEESDLLIKEKVRKSLKYSIFDGSFYSSMVGFGESFISAFAVFLKSNTIVIGLLGSLPQFLGSLSQLLSNHLLSLFKSRKRMVCTFAFLQGLMYIPILLVFFMGEMRAVYLLIFTCLYFFFGMLISPAWNSWMGDLVKKEERGYYFGRRNRIAGFVSFVTFLGGGYLLQSFTDGTSTQYIGFMIIFILAFLSRVISFIFLIRQYEPSFEISNEARFSFVEFVRDSFKRNFNRFVTYLVFMNFSVYIAAPFFTAYMLYDLKFSYITFTVINAAALLAKFISMPLWGKICDKYGTRKVLAFSGLLMPFVPLLWVFTNNIQWLLLIQVFSGFIWAGFEIASFNYIFDATTPQKRTTCVAYYNVLNGVGIFLGALVGSFIVKHNKVFASAFLLVFLISFILRISTSLIFIPMLKEFRRVENISYKDMVFKMVGGSIPNMGFLYDLITFKHNHEHDIHKKNVTNNNVKGSGKNIKPK